MWLVVHLTQITEVHNWPWLGLQCIPSASQPTEHWQTWNASQDRNMKIHWPWGAWMWRPHFCCLCSTSRSTRLSQRVSRSCVQMKYPYETHHGWCLCNSTWIVNYILGRANESTEIWSLNHIHIKTFGYVLVVTSTNFKTDVFGSFWRVSQVVDHWSWGLGRQLFITIRDGLIDT